MNEELMSLLAAEQKFRFQVLEDQAPDHIQRKIGVKLSQVYI